MNPQLSQHTSISPALAADFPTSEPRPVLSTVTQFSERNPAFSPAALRNLVFKAGPRLSSNGEVPGNGLIECGAILRIGRKVLIDEARFFEWVRRQNEVRQ
jgi:hypothetical protein